MISLVCGIKKNDTNELIYKTETDFWFLKRKGDGGDKLGIWE